MRGGSIRWIRGDWQILFWLFPFVPSRRGLKRNTLPLIARWKILDNLRRSLVVADAARACWSPAGRSLPGARWFWTPPCWSVLASQLLPLVAQPGHRPGPVAVGAGVPAQSGARCAIALAQVILSVTFLPFHAFDALHAIGVTLVRLIVTKRRLLEWETAATTAARAAGLAGRQRVCSICAEMMASPIIAAGLAVVFADRAPRTRCRVATPFLLLWLVRAGRSRTGSACRSARGCARSPTAERVLSSPHRAQDVAVFRDVRHRGRRLAAARQLSGERRGAAVAHRTSPTNIGMSLLSTLAAHDLGYLTTADVARAPRSHADDARGAGALSRALPQLVRHDDAGASASAVCLHASTAATWPRR